MKVEKIVKRFNLPLEVAVDSADKFNFELFKDNFRKNNGGFPYIDNDKVKIGAVYADDKPVGLIAYGFPSALKSYRESHDDPKTDYGHIFDFEIDSEHRGLGLGDVLMNTAIIKIKESGANGVTLKAINKKIAEHYKSKFGFIIEDGEENEHSPMMFKSF